MEYTENDIINFPYTNHHTKNLEHDLKLYKNVDNIVYYWHDVDTGTVAYAVVKVNTHK